MSRAERQLVERVRAMADALLSSKRHEEHAARYLLGVTIQQLQTWAREQQEPQA